MRIGGCGWQQALLQSSQAGAQGCGEEAEIAHFHEAARQDMLEEALDEVLHGESTGFELAGVGGAVLESELGSFHAATVMDGEQAPVADGDAVDVRGQILESSLPIADLFAIDNPFSPPDLGRDVGVEGGSAQSALEGSAEQLGEGLHMQEEVFAGGQPRLPITAYPAAGSQVMHVGMVEQVAGPGVQHAYHANLPAHKAWIFCQLLGCPGGSAEEQVVDQLLVLAGNLAQFRWKREGQQEVRDAQEQSLLHFQPVLGLLVLAFGAVAVAAGVIAVADFTAGRADEDLPTQRLGAATLNGAHSLVVAGQQAGGVFLAIGGTVLAKDISQF